MIKRVATKFIPRIKRAQKVFGGRNSSYFSIGAKQAQPCAGLQRKLQMLEYRTARVSQRGVLQLGQVRDLLHVDAARLHAVLAEAGPLAAAAAAIERRRVEVTAGEPLTLELQAFLRSLGGAGSGAAPAEAGRAALAVAAEVRAAMKLRAKRWADRASAGS